MEKKILTKTELEEMKRKLYAYGSGDLASGCYSSYIGDGITEIADGNIDYYYSDLFEWCKDNFEYVNEALEEFGTTNNIIKDIQQGQYLYYSQEIYSELEDIIYNYAINYILENDLEISAEQFEEIEDNLYKIDNNSRFDDIDDLINEIIDNSEEEEEENK